MSRGRCAFVPVMDDRICRILGGVPYPEDLNGLPANGGSGRGGIFGAGSYPGVGFVPERLLDAILEPGILNWDDPDSRPVWIWDLE